MLLAMGILSAEPHVDRRNAIRSTWLRFPEVISAHSVLALFLVAVDTFGGAVHDGCIRGCNVGGALSKEQNRHGDTMVLATGMLQRGFGPLVSLYRFLRLATSMQPYSQAAFLARLDDDCFVRIPELLHHLYLISGLHMRYVLYGVRYYTSWNQSGDTWDGAGNTIEQAWKSKAQSVSLGPYAHAGAPMQLLSRDLALAISASENAREYVERAYRVCAARADCVVHNTSDPRYASKATPTVKFASEDTWLGYALVELLPLTLKPTAVVHVSVPPFSPLAHEVPHNFFNTTVLFHDRSKRKDASLLHAAFEYAKHGFRCTSNSSIVCQWVWGRACGAPCARTRALSGQNVSERRVQQQMCYIRPPPCPIIRQDLQHRSA